MIYDPKEDSYLLREQVKIYSKGKSFLDMGSGSGIQSLIAVHAGAKSVIATDINSESTKATEKLGISSITSNLFSKISGKFDLIAFNPPYLPEDSQEDKESRLITTGGKKGDEIILAFLKQSVNHLNKEGIILLLVSSLTPKDRILNLLKKIDLNFSVLSRKNIFMETLEVWKIER